MTGCTCSRTFLLFYLLGLLAVVEIHIVSDTLILDC